MSIYPPTQTTPKSPSGNYLWNWLGSPLKKFAAALSPYIGGDVGYKKYVALLSQNASDPPVATILENTLGGTPVWTYQSQGLYECILTNAFPLDKTFCLVTRGNYWGNLVMVYFGQSSTADSLYMYCMDPTTLATDIQNAPAKDVYVEIRVYP